MLKAICAKPRCTNMAVMRRHHCDAGKGFVRAPNRLSVRPDVGDPVSCMRRNTITFAMTISVVT